METEIITETTNQTKFFITFISVSLGGSFLFANVAVTFREPIIGEVGLVLCILIPFIFIKKIILFFTKRVKIVFFEDHFLLMMMDLNSALVLNENQFFYQNILSCTINSAQVKTSSICLELVSGGKKKYIFTNSKGVDIGNIGEIIYVNIKLRKPDVVLKPAFFGSNNGRAYVIGMAILLTILLFLHIFYSPQTSPATFLISISLYVSIWAQRKKDIERFKRLSVE
ncbi:MAG: hypothetical protein M3O71_13350 [Bacteroidota bacterium]|nr:hypothetical protein [Bacteroidota bacterium]